MTEEELGRDENYFQGPAPIVGDVINVRCHGRNFDAKVVWGNWPGEVMQRRQLCRSGSKRFSVAAVGSIAGVSGPKYNSGFRSIADLSGTPA